MGALPSKIHIDLHNVGEAEIVRLLKINSEKNDEILRLLKIIMSRQFLIGEGIMKTLDDVLADVEQQKTVNASARKLLEQISAQIRATAGDPAKIEALAASLEANNADLADAVLTNTPAAAVEPPATA